MMICPLRAAGEYLFRLPVCAILVYLLYKVESLLLLAVFRDQSLAVVPVLEQRDVPRGRTKVHKHPRSEAAYLRNLGKHDEVVAIEVELELFGPALIFGAVVSSLRLGSKFSNDDRLLRHLELDSFRLVGRVAIPAYVFVHADYIRSEEH